MPYILPVLKLLGLFLTAFFGVAEHFRRKGKSPEIERRNRRWSIGAILLSLIVAAGAEIIDVTSKKHEATEAANRAAESARQTQQIVNDLDRSLHPLFPIKIKPVFKVELNHPSLASYRDRLVKAFPANEEALAPELAPGSPLFPDRNREPVAYALLTAAPQTTIFLVRNPANPPVPIGNEEPDLSISLKNTSAEPPATAGHKQKPGTKVEIEYGYTKDGSVSIEYPTETINVTDHYSKGKIISPSDLLGSQMSIEIWPAIGIGLVAPARDQSPIGHDDMDSLSESFGISWIDIELPGSQEIQLQSKDFERVPYRGHNVYVYTFPKTKEELSKMFLP